MITINKLTRALYVNGPVDKINEIIDALNALMVTCIFPENLEEAVTLINTMIQGINNRIDSVDATLNSHSNEIGSLQARTTALENVFNTLNGDLDSIRNSILQNTNNIAEHTNTISSHANNIAANTEAIARLREDVSALQNALSDFSTALEELEQNLKEYIDRNDFINIAPKIGYYQEDKIQTISTYEISNVPDMEKNAPLFTSDNVGREIMYYIGNGGGADADSTTGLRKAYRVNDTANWIWYNQDIIPACFANQQARINRLYGCDNTYLLCKMSDGSFHLIHTNYSFNENEWVNEDDVSSMIVHVESGDHFLHAKYLEDYDTFITFNGISRALTQTNWFRVRVWKYSTKELLRQDDIPGCAPYTILQSGYSFLPTRTVTCIYTELTEDERLQYGNFAVSISSVESQYACNITLIEEKETLVICIGGMQFSAYNTTTGNRKYQSVSNVPLSYRFPLSVARGEATGQITCNLRPGDIRMGDATPFLSEATRRCSGSRAILCAGAYSNSSYDTLRGYIYRSRRDYTGAVLTFTRTKQDDIDAEDPRFNCLQKDYYKTALYTPDASYWGKYFRMSAILWDTIFLNCQNSNGSWLLWVKDWRLVKNHENSLVIEPVPGKYIPIDKTKFYDVLLATYDASLYKFTTSNPKAHTSTFDIEKGFTSVKCQDNSARYFKSEYTNGQIKTREFHKKETYTTDGSMESFEIESEDLDPINVTIQASAFNTGDADHTFIFGSHVIYNPMAEMYFVFGELDIGDREENDNIARNHIVGIKQDGTVVSYGEPRDHIWPFTDNKIEHYTTTYQTPWMPSGSNWINKYTLQVFFEESHNGGHSACGAIFRFNNDFTDYEVINAKGLPQGIYWMGYGAANLQMHCLMYAGPRLGFCGQGQTVIPRSYTDNFKINIRTQNALFGTQTAEKDYTEEEIIQDYLYEGINNYTMYNQSASGLICYVPSIPIFLGGYYTEIVDAIPVVLQPNLNSETPGSSDGRYDANYVYLERDALSRTKINAYAMPIKIIEEGSAMFNKILVAKIETDDEKAIASYFYTINIGYNNENAFRDYANSHFLRTDGSSVMSGGIKFLPIGEIGAIDYKHTDTDKTLRQLVISTTDINEWGTIGGAELTLLKHDATGTNPEEDGSFSLLASSDIDYAVLYGDPTGTLEWSGQSIQTSSDKRKKQDFSNVPDEVLDAWGKINWVQFKYIADAKRKGTENCRWHTGIVAQDVKEVGEENSVDLCQYGILCQNMSEPNLNGEISNPWTVRYEEALAMEAIYQRRRADKLEERIRILEETIRQGIENNS